MNPNFTIDEIACVRNMAEGRHNCTGEVRFASIMSKCEAFLDPRRIRDTSNSHAPADRKCPKCDNWESQGEFICDQCAPCYWQGLRNCWGDEDFTIEELQKISVMMSQAGERMCESHCKQLLYSIHKRAEGRISKQEGMSADLNRERKKAANLDRHKNLFRWLQGPPLHKEPLVVTPDETMTYKITCNTNETYQNTHWQMHVYPDHWEFISMPNDPTLRSIQYRGRFVDDTSLLFEIIEQ